MSPHKTETRIVVLASRNADKVRELRELCVSLPFEIRSAVDYPGLPEVIEDGTTILGNATRKAVATAAYTGEIAVADDTSLCVHALNEMPDIFAARFAGPEATYADNCTLLSELMAEVPEGRRQAWFSTAAVWVDPRQAKSGRPTAPGVNLRLFHHPYRRSIHVADPTQEDAYWNSFIDRRAVWTAYIERMSVPGTAPGVDQDRLVQILDGLCAEVRHGGRPQDAGADELRLPDPRIWTASGADDVREPTRITPTGLPAEAPGRAVAAPVWSEFSSTGKVLGEIVTMARGGRGFGYDPIFRPAGSDRTLAEMSPEEKNTLSHRGRAMRRLLDGVADAYS